MIAILDWGIGGWFALRALRNRAPSVDLVYLADSGTVPYGLQPRADLARTVHQRVAWLADQGATSVFLACHSASTALRDLEPALPTVGVLDASAVPIDAERVLLLGGQRTIRSGLWHKQVRGRVPQVQVTGRVSQPLSAWIEAGNADGAPCKAYLHRQLRGQWDTVVLACTHYAALRAQISRTLPDARVVDPALSVAARLEAGSGSGVLRTWTTGDPGAMATVLHQLFGETLKPEVAALTRPGQHARRCDAGGHLLP